MANKMRWRYGDTNPVVLPVATDTVIEIGDFIMAASGAALPASALEDVGSESGNQEAFHDVFVGIAMQASPAGENDPIRVATSGVFELTCPSATHNVGDLIGVDEAGSGDVLEDQVAVGVATANLAIGRCAKRDGSATNAVLVEIVSTVLRGGPQAMA